MWKFGFMVFGIFLVSISIPSLSLFFAGQYPFDIFSSTITFGAGFALLIAGIYFLKKQTIPIENYKLLAIIGTTFFIFASFNAVCFGTCPAPINTTNAITIIISIILVLIAVILFANKKLNKK